MIGHMIKEKQKRKAGKAPAFNQIPALSSKLTSSLLRKPHNKKPSASMLEPQPREG